MKFVFQTFPHPGSEGAVSYSPTKTGTNSAQIATNNFASKSQTFQQMNALVNNLDATFKGLSLADKGTWEAAQPAYASTGLCGCQHGIDSAQKLFRVTNFTRSIAGLPLTNIVPGPQPLSGNYVFEVLHFFSPPYPAEIVFLHTIEGPSESRVIFQLGQGLKNPAFLFPPLSDGVTITPTDPDWGVFAKLSRGQIVNTCVSDGVGLPFLLVAALVEFFP